MDTVRQNIDFSALKFNQISIVTLCAAGFILDQPILPVLVSVVLIAGSINRNMALFKSLYKVLIKPLGLMKPNQVEDIPAPHEFAQLLGGIVLGIGSVLLYSDLSIPGWALVWVVIILAGANLFFGFCAGCFVYYQLRKLGLPGFKIQSL